MQKFDIYHCTGTDMFTTKIDRPREYVGSIEAESFEDAYYHSQNLTQDSWNTTTPTRSTSVGDLLVSKGVVNMVKGIGFQEIEMDYSVLMKLIEKYLNIQMNNKLI